MFYGVGKWLFKLGLYLYYDLYLSPHVFTIQQILIGFVLCNM